METRDYLHMANQVGRQQRMAAYAKAFTLQRRESSLRDDGLRRDRPA
jgi:hypothetical protein